MTKTGKITSQPGRQFLVWLVAPAVLAGTAARAASEVSDLDALVQAGKYQQAREKCNALLSRYPQRADLHLWYANLARKTGQTNAAMTHYEKTAGLAPRLSEPHVAMAEIYLQNLDVERSLAQARLALHLDPEDRRAGMVLVSALAQTDRLDEGQAQIKKLLEHDPKNANVLWLAYQLQLRKGDYFQAKQLLEQAVKAKPGNTSWLLELAELQERSGEPALARQILTRVVASDPESAAAHLKLARNLEVWDKQYDQAADEYMQAMRLDSTSNLARVGLERCRAKKNNLALRLKLAMRSWLQGLLGH